LQREDGGNDRGRPGSPAAERDRRRTPPPHPPVAASGLRSRGIAGNARFAAGRLISTMPHHDLFRVLQDLSVLALPVLLAITSHEAAHGIVAYWLGDDTAYRQGRVSLNPVRHIDPFGTVVLPTLLYVTGRLYLGGGFLFGYAKPVPINAGR